MVYKSVIIFYFGKKNTIYSVFLQLRVYIHLDYKSMIKNDKNCLEFK